MVADRLETVLALLDADARAAAERHARVMSAFDRLDAAFDAIQIRSTAANPHLSGSEPDPMSED